MTQLHHTTHHSLRTVVKKLHWWSNTDRDFGSENDEMFSPPESSVSGNAVVCPPAAQLSRSVVQLHAELSVQVACGDTAQACCERDTQKDSCVNTQGEEATVVSLYDTLTL